MIKVNIDLNRSLGYYGIANYKREISRRLVNDEKYAFYGCKFWKRSEKRCDHSWFQGQMKYSLLPEFITSKTNLSLPFTYEYCMGSKVDVNIFFTYLLPCLRFEDPVIATIHDIILLKANSETKEVIDEHKRILENTVKHSSYILTVSEASKRDICDYFNVSKNNVGIVHNGLNQDYLNFKATEEGLRFVRNKYGLPENFILYFGGYRVHKNIENLLYAYAKLPKDVKQELKIVLLKHHPNIDNIISELHIEDDVTFIGFVDESDKYSVYALSKMVYYASLYEGFGVPVIEAQAVGVPVITSNTSSMPEASGGAAMLVDPHDADAIKNAILDLVDDKTLCSRLIAEGKKNASQYTWERSVHEFRHELDKYFAKK